MAHNTTRFYRTWQFSCGICGDQGFDAARPRAGEVLHCPEGCGATGVVRWGGRKGWVADWEEPEEEDDA